MPLTKEDTDRAISILEGLLTEASALEEEEGEGAEHYGAIQATLDLLQSPLFSALVDIRNQYQQTVEESQVVSPAAEVKLSEKPELVPQFCQRYGIPGSHQNGIGGKNGDSPLTSINEIMEDGVSSPSSVTQALVDSEVEGFGSTLAEHQHQRQLHDSMQPSVGSAVESIVGVNTASGEIKQKNKRKKGRWSVGSGAGGRREKRVSEEQSGITLAHLAHPTKDEGISMSSFSQEADMLRVRGSSESSLSSFSSESSQQATIPPQRKPHSSKGKVSSGDGGGGEGGGERGPRDILFFMRDKRSRTEIREAVYTRYGHESREVKLSPSAGGQGLGVETVGLSSTGVFVSRGRVEGVQVGDQILAVNGQTTDGMASFEVNQLIKDVPAGLEIVLVLQYNPVGLIYTNNTQKKGLGMRIVTVGAELLCSQAFS